LWICTVVTLFCLVLGYPLAYLIATTSPPVARGLLTLTLLPFWTSILVRTAAWVVILQQQGVVNGLLQWAGVIDHPLTLIYNRVGVYVVMTHVLLPFMVLPIYSVMKGIPKNLLPAAASLGARPLAAFVQVYVPQSQAGVAAGCLMTFVLALGYYVTPALVGGATDQMESGLIAHFALSEGNWGMAASLAVILLLVVLLAYAAYARFSKGTALRWS
jgi:putative spermidine/putrescine transport system permease protein